MCRGQAQVPDHVEGACLPVRVKAALGLLEEEVAGGVQARHRPSVEEPCKTVPGEHVQAVVHDQRGCVGDQAKDAQGLRPDSPARRLRAPPTLPGEPVKVPAFGLVEAEDAGERVEDLLGGLGRAALLQAYVVVDADSDRCATSSRRSPSTRRRLLSGDADGRRIDPGTPGPQEARKIVHAPSMATVVPVEVALPVPGSPLLRKRSP